MRLLILIGLVVGLYFIVKKVMQRVRTIQNQFVTDTQAEQTHSQKMVACAYCAVHIPQTEAIEVSTQGRKLSFCSQAHLNDFIQQQTKA